MQGIHGYIFERVIIETLINKDQNVRHVSQIDKDKAMDKISIRFYNNKEVRAIWSDDDSRWYYSATDIVRAINNETDYVKQVTIGVG